MQTEPTPAPKYDNLFGICHALGDAFGFNPLFLRLAIVLGILINFEATAILYAAAGVAVLAAHGASHLLGRRRGMPQG